MAHAFRIVNVFTAGADRFSGNPLCVVEDGGDLSTEQMQAIARQFNVSETTFILPATSPDATVRARIFTPGFEMPFAGHPTLGTAHVVRDLSRSPASADSLHVTSRSPASADSLHVTSRSPASADSLHVTSRSPASADSLHLGRPADVDRVVLELAAGLVPVTAIADSWTLRAARAPVTRPFEASRADTAAMLAISVDALAGEPLWVNTGVEQLVIPLRSGDDVRAVRPDPALLARWGYSAARDEAMAYVWARDGADHELAVRFFFTSHGAVIEDPATGSACANLGGWYLATGAALPLERALRQGDAVARPSRLGLRVAADRAIYVTGAVIELGRGSITVA